MYYSYVDTIWYGMLLYGKSVQYKRYSTVPLRVKFSTVTGTIYTVEDVEKDALTQNFNILRTKCQKLIFGLNELAFDHPPTNG